jgi:hypothetical protein
MISSLARKFGRAATRKHSRRSPVSARRSMPRLETLEGRTVPGGLSGRVITSVTAHAALPGVGSGPN